MLSEEQAVEKVYSEIRKLADNITGKRGSYQEWVDVHSECIDHHEMERVEGSIHEIGSLLRVLDLIEVAPDKRDALFEESVEAFSDIVGE